MKFTNDEDDTEEKENYLLKEGKKYYYILQDVKTSNSTGIEKIELKNPVLIKILDKKNFRNGDIVYGKKEKGLRGDVNRETTKIFGVRLTPSEIRVLHSTHKFSKENVDKLKEMLEDAKASGHSIQTKTDFYIKDIPSPKKPLPQPETEKRKKINKKKKIIKKGLNINTEELNDPDFIDNIIKLLEKRLKNMKSGNNKLAMLEIIQELKNIEVEEI